MMISYLEKAHEDHLMSNEKILEELKEIDIQDGVMKIVRHINGNVIPALQKEEELDERHIQSFINKFMELSEEYINTLERAEIFKKEIEKAESQKTKRNFEELLEDTKTDPKMKKWVGGAKESSATQIQKRFRGATIRDNLEGATIRDNLEDAKMRLLGGLKNKSLKRKKGRKYTRGKKRRFRKSKKKKKRKIKSRRNK